MTKTSTRILLAWLFISLVGVVSPALAQSQQPPTQLTERDKQNINAAALKSLNRLNVLLNALAVEGLEDAEVDTIIKKSYSGPARIFDNVNVSIEDDINPEHTSATKTEDLKVDEYLNRLSLYYSKRSPNDDKVTIIFPKQEATAAQQNGSSTYIKVFFESVFKGKYIPKSSSYQPASRVIELRAEKPGQYWRVYITRFSFKQPGEGMQQVVGTGRPTIPPGIKVGGAEIPYRKTGTEQLVVLKFTTQWLEVVNSQETDLPTGIYKRKIKETGQISEAQIYDFDNTRAIELKENSNRFSFRNDITNTWFDRVNPIINKPTAPQKPVIPQPDTTRQIASQRPKVKPPVVAPTPPIKTDSTKAVAVTNPVTKTKPTTATVAAPSTITPAKSPLIKPDTARSLALNKTPTPANPEQEPKEPLASITMKQRKTKAGSVLQSDSAQRVTDQIAGLQSSKPSALPSKMPSLMSVLRKDSVDMATTELYIKPQPETKKVESLVKAPKAPPIGSTLEKSLNSEDKKLKARYRMQGWLQIAAGVAGLAGSYLAYSAIKTDYDAYSAKMEKLNTEYSNWQAVSRQPLGAAVTPLSMTSYGKPATYGVYAGGAISLGAVINGIRFLGKAGKIKSKSNPSLPNTIPSPPPTIISNKK